MSATEALSFTSIEDGGEQDADTQTLSNSVGRRAGLTQNVQKIVGIDDADAVKERGFERYIGSAFDGRDFINNTEGEFVDEPVTTLERYVKYLDKTQVALEKRKYHKTEDANLLEKIVSEKSLIADPMAQGIMTSNEHVNRERMQLIRELTELGYTVVGSSNPDSRGNLTRQSDVVKDPQAVERLVDRLTSENDFAALRAKRELHKYLQVSREARKHRLNMILRDRLEQDEMGSARAVKRQDPSEYFLQPVRVVQHRGDNMQEDDQEENEGQYAPESSSKDPSSSYSKPSLVTAVQQAIPLLGLLPKQSLTQTHSEEILSLAVPGGNVRSSSLFLTEDEGATRVNSSEDEVRSDVLTTEEVDQIYDLLITQQRQGRPRKQDHERYANTRSSGLGDQLRRNKVQERLQAHLRAGYKSPSKPTQSEHQNKAQSATPEEATALSSMLSTTKPTMESSEPRTKLLERATDMSIPITEDAENKCASSESDQPEASSQESLPREGGAAPAGEAPPSEEAQQLTSSSNGSISDFAQSVLSKVLTELRQTIPTDIESRVTSKTNESTSRAVSSENDSPDPADNSNPPLVEPAIPENSAHDATPLAETQHESVSPTLNGDDPSLTPVPAERVYDEAQDLEASKPLTSTSAIEGNYHWLATRTPTMPVTGQPSDRVTRKRPMSAMSARSYEERQEAVTESLRRSAEEAKKLLLESKRRHEALLSKEAAERNAAEEANQRRQELLHKLADALKHQRQKLEKIVEKVKLQEKAKEEERARIALEQRAAELQALELRAQEREKARALERKAELARRKAELLRKIEEDRQRAEALERKLEELARRKAEREKLERKIKAKKEAEIAYLDALIAEDERKRREALEAKLRAREQQRQSQAKHSMRSSISEARLERPTSSTTQPTLKAQSSQSYSRLPPPRPESSRSASSVVSPPRHQAEPASRSVSRAAPVPPSSLLSSSSIPRAPVPSGYQPALHVDRDEQVHSVLKTSPNPRQMLETVENQDQRHATVGTQDDALHFSLFMASSEKQSPGYRVSSVPRPSSGQSNAGLPSSLPEGGQLSTGIVSTLIPVSTPQAPQSADDLDDLESFVLPKFPIFNNTALPTSTPASAQKGTQQQLSRRSMRR